jgi:hypothetical protein
MIRFPRTGVVLTGAILGLLCQTGRARLTAQCGPNPIVCENLLTGSPKTEWDITGAGDSTLQGFATEISANIGETVRFKVNTTATLFNIDIYRMGYYNGMGARKVASIPGVAGHVQPACLTDNATHLVDCGNWAQAASWTIPTTAVSGIYFAKLSRPDTGGTSHIVFVVRNDAGSSDLLFQTSDTTWQAYNAYGGFSLYSETPARKVSYNRPFATRGQGGDGLGTSNFVFYVEYPMVRFLEANGYNVTYSSGVDTDRRGALLTGHKVFLSVGHDEYWSAAQRANVEAARNAGVHLAFFSGNEIFWKTRWENSIDGMATPYRTLVTYKETHSNQVTDPADPPTWTGTWRDPRFSPPGDGGRPENAVSGQIYTVDRGSAAITVPAAFAPLRFWRNTAVANLVGAQTATLGSETIGYEWDQDLDNGFRPAGLMRLSSTTVNAERYLVDFGTIVSPATLTHNLTLYRHASGALVFGAGTVQWSWGLDVHHDIGPDIGDPNPDPSMQQATINVLADMGVQPGTLMSGLFPATASTDHVAAESVISSPATGAVVAVGSRVTITGTASDTGGGVVGGVEVSVDGGASWHRADGRENWIYSWRPGALGATTVLSRAVDDSGNLEQPVRSTAVTVIEAQCPCSVWDSAAVPWRVDVDDLNPVELGFRFRSEIDGTIRGIRFYKSDNNTGVHTGSLWSGTGTMLATATFVNETASGWQQVLFDSPVTVNAGITYVASYHTDAGHYSTNSFYFGRSGVNQWPLRALATGVDGPSGVYTYNPGEFPTQTFQAANYWVDVVFAPIDVTPPTVTNRAPNGATPVSVATSVAATFDEAMKVSSINSSTFSLRDVGGNAVPATVSYNMTTATATLTPVTALLPATTYTATLSAGLTGVKDLSGNPLAANVSWSFVTSGITTCPCTIWSAAATPALIASDSNPVELGVRFRADTAGVITGVRFYKGADNTGTHTGSLWTNSGTLLATATFSAESVSGWQEVLFDAPVPVAANTTYVASYHTNSGNYAVGGGYFAAAGNDSPPLHALASGVDGLNGVYSYGPGGFPSQSFNASNYWVDVVFALPTVDATAPTVTGTAPNGGSVSVGTSVTATFSEPMAASSVSTSTFTLRSPGGGVLAATVAYNANTNAATLTPASPLSGSTTYTATVAGGASGVKDLYGNAMASNAVWTFTTAANASCPCSLWNSSTTPVQMANDTSAVELGVRFRAETSGVITGVRFFKGPANTGTHTGSLWASNGMLLATAVFTGESASGWQQVLFDSPFPVAANTTYIASYHTSTGNYAVDGGYFSTTGVDNSPLHALATGVDGPNGLYLYGDGAFPTQSYNASNYWVDVVFTTGGPDTTPPTVTSIAPNGATPVTVGTSVTATFSEPMNAATMTAATMTLTGPGGPVAATVSYAAGSNVATLTPATLLAPQTTYTATVRGGTPGVKDAAGNAMVSDTVWSFVTGAGLTCPCSIWSASSTPGQIANDSNAVELGVRLRSSVDGLITGVRFYKGANNTGIHTGTLWSSTGTLLATVTFTGETASGWQQMNFSTPVAITANTTYVVSYHTDTGNYAVNGAYFATVGVDNMPLSALASGVDGPNGVYVYGGSAFPTHSYNASNYWVDVVFTPQ